MHLPATDVERRRGLRRMQAVALGLLLAAAAVFVATLDRSGGWGYVNAAAEAAMVGAVADWFAVVALFRHPLGLPIPHTALVPTRKDELASSLQEFVTENFLSDEVVRERAAEAQPSRRVGEWLAEAGHRERLVREGSVMAQAALHRLDDADVRDLLEHEILPRLQDEPMSPVAGGLLSEVIAEGAHRGPR